MAITGLDLSERKVAQTINLEQILGVSFKGEKALRLAIAQAAIDHIIERTQSGKAVQGGGFKPYSKDYKDSTAFKLLKDDGAPVNMTLTGSMLADIDVLGDGENTIQIGFRDKTETAKAFNHNTGDTLPKRPFFGISDKEIKSIVKDQFSREISRLKGNPNEALTVAEVMRTGIFLSSLEGSTTAEGFFFSTVADILGV